MTTDTDGVLVDETHKLNSYMLIKADPVLLMFDALARWQDGSGSLAEVRQLSKPVQDDMAAAFTDGRMGFEDDPHIAGILARFEALRDAIDQRAPAAAPAPAERRI